MLVLITVNSLTLSNSKQVAQICDRVALGWLRACDISQWQERVIVTRREIRKTQNVMALLSIHTGAIHTAVQNLRADKHNAEGAMKYTPKYPLKQQGVTHHDFTL